MANLAVIDSFVNQTLSIRPQADAYCRNAETPAESSSVRVAGRAAGSVENTSRSDGKLVNVPALGNP
jgi:hypothetical protein